MDNRDAIIGARYKDSVFGDEFEIIAIEPDAVDSHDPTEITVTLEYDTIGTITIDLAQFRADRGIEMVAVDSTSA